MIASACFAIVIGKSWTLRTHYQCCGSGSVIICTDPCPSVIKQTVRKTLIEIYCFVTSL
jgi:hypothetical protein